MGYVAVGFGSLMMIGVDIAFCHISTVNGTICEDYSTMHSAKGHSPPIISPNQYITTLKGLSYA